MRKLFFVFLAALFLAAALDAQERGHPIPPGVREADKLSDVPLEPPKAKAKGNLINLADLQKEAEELAKLSAAIPSQVEQVAHGHLPKDLADQLKHIEKMAKHMRSQISP